MNDEQHYAHIELLTKTIESLRDENKQLKDCAKAFAFILPEPHKDILDSITHTELYRMQHKMAKKQWLDWFNSHSQ